MAFRDWEDVEASDLLVLPIFGTEYRIRPLGHLDAIKLREDMAGISEGRPPLMSGEEFLVALLGPALQKMRGADVPPQSIIHAAVTASIDELQDRQTAEEFWEKGPNKQALAVAMEAVSAVSTTSPTSDADASSTKKPASTSGTKPRKQASRSRGTRSSSTPASSRRTSSPSTGSGSPK